MQERECVWGRFAPKLRHKRDESHAVPRADFPVCCVKITWNTLVFLRIFALPTKKSAPRDFAEPCRRKFFVRQGKGSFAYWAYGKRFFDAAFTKNFPCMAYNIRLSYALLALDKWKRICYSGLRQTKVESHAPHAVRLFFACTLAISVLSGARVLECNRT